MRQDSIAQAKRCRLHRARLVFLFGNEMRNRHPNRAGELT
jgi:hypothetical protein